MITQEHSCSSLGQTEICKVWPKLHWVTIEPQAELQASDTISISNFLTENSLVPNADLATFTCIAYANIQSQDRGDYDKITYVAFDQFSKLDASGITLAVTADSDYANQRTMVDIAITANFTLVNSVQV